MTALRTGLVRYLPHLFLLFAALSPYTVHSQRSSGGDGGYLGRYIGPLSRLNHGVSGEVYAVDARTLHIRDFTYDGEGPAAFFYAGNTKTVGPGGFFIRDESGSNGVLKKYNRKHITITLPEGKTLHSIRWFSVWCDEFSVNFGSVEIPRGLDYPKPQKTGRLSGVHGVSSGEIVVVDAQTLLVPSFSYDGEAPDAKFWVGRGAKPSPQGIRVPDENGKQTPLRRYERKTIVLTLPGDLTVFDIGHFGVWCEAFTVDFGHVQIPAGLNVPPSLKMLGVSPQKRSLSDGRAEADGRQTAAAGNYGGDHRPTTYRPPLPSLPSPAHRFATVQLQRSIEPAFLSYQQPQQVYSNPYQQQQVYSNPYQQQVFNFNYQQQQQQDNYIRQPVVQNQYDFAQQRSFTSQQYF